MTRPRGTPEPRALTTMGSRAYFVVGSIGDGRLWVSDGTPEGTLPVFADDAGSVEPTALTDVAARLFFAAIDPAIGRLALWTSGGTAAGTAPVTGITHDVYVSVTDTVAFGDRLVFVVRDPEGAAVWVSDGTDAGTRQLRPRFPPGVPGSEPGDLTAQVVPRDY